LEVTDKRYEIEQHKLSLQNLQTDLNYKLEQIRSKIADVRDLIDKQEREQQKTATRIAQRKEEQEKLNARRNYLI
jgi:septal ring factor EnvC (AmiA/AmiB activator)